MFAKKSIFSIFVLLLPLLINPAAVNASGMGGVVPLITKSNTIENAVSVTAGSEMGPISAGWHHTCALTSTSGMMCWGRNDYGQLGNNSTTNSLIPVNVSGLSSGMSAMVGGRWHTCALTTTGGVLCWGGNLSGQLGDKSYTTRHTPVNVWGLSSGVTAIAAGFYHTCALTAAGGMMCWGHNGNGQLGTDINTPTIPVFVDGLSSGVSAIAAGFYHTCALTTAGGVKCWGDNLFGQLGNNSTTNSPIPVDVIGLSSGVSAIAAGDDHTCVLTTTGGVKCWGNNNSGQLGNNSNARSLIPIDVSDLSSGVSAIAAGGLHTCALTTTGGVKCWGSGGVGGNDDDASIIPVDVRGLSSGVSAITTGQFHTCALTITGQLKCWGSNNYGQLGNNSTTNSSVPVDVHSVAPPTTIFADVLSTYWAWPYIERLYNAGITGGCNTSPLMYCPLDPVTRTQMAIFILRGMYGKNYTPPAATGTVFSDVLVGTFGAAWIEQFAKEGITTGCGGGKYCPDDNVTRAQMAIFLLRGKHGSTYIPPVATGVFPDVPVGSFAADWIEQLAKETITSGCGGGLYCPNSNVTRDQMAVFLVKTFNLP